ncbi:pyruvate, phosphate dikinase [Candidatus Bathyarchaeota archaeon]|nr:MAG: pyruvate, phosphate dikinase [Candidatus Bathyarchaeota archaeon]
MALLFEEAIGLSKMDLGGKGFGLVEMTRLGLPVPPGLIIPTYVCREYYRLGRLPDGLMDSVLEKIKKIEAKVGRKFGSKEKPLLLSVRSGAPVSMPGMMDTILNLGLNDEVVESLAEETGNRRFAYDAYRRLLEIFGRVVLKVPDEKFDEAFERCKEKVGVSKDVELPAEALTEIVEEFKEIIREAAGIEFPQDPRKQLEMSVEAVFKSWNNPRAKMYRRMYKISDELGTAVNVQMMVFGNLGWNSGTGVCFTRDPSTGEKRLYGEYLRNAQGEDVVSGVRTPKPIDELKKEFPKIYEQLLKIAETLERHFKDMQDIEFTIQEGKLYILQTRTGKRTPRAAVKIAVDMVKEGLITKEEAVGRVDLKEVIRLLQPRISSKCDLKPIAKGLNASPGIAIGKVVFKIEDAVKYSRMGEKVILVRPETKPEDIKGVVAAVGVLTSRGGRTSHAAVVTRALGKPAVVGAEAIKIDLENELFKVNNTVVKKLDVITIDGGTGNIYLGEVPLEKPKLSPELREFLEWAIELGKPVPKIAQELLSSP